MACACGGKMRWMRRRPAEVSVSRTTRRSVPLCRRRTSPRLTSLSTTYVVLDDSTRMRRCTSQTGSSPLWYSTSRTPNSVVPTPKRAMLAREWRSTASNARASTTHSSSGTSWLAGDGRFILLQEPSPRGFCSRVCRNEVSRYRDNSWRRWDHVCGSWIAGAPADAGAGVPEPRRAEGVRRVRRTGLRRRHGVHRQPGLPPGAALGRPGGRRGARRGAAVPAWPAHAAGESPGARDHDGRDRQGAWPERVLRAERRIRVQPRAQHRRAHAGPGGTRGVLARSPARARPLTCARGLGPAVPPALGL